MAVAAADAADLGPMEDERRWALACITDEPKASTSQHLLETAPRSSAVVWPSKRTAT